MEIINRLKYFVNILYIKVGLSISVKTIVGQSYFL
ncbi:hypothetical protein N3C_0851 [Clostridium sp. N3C]|nr:hypothetical protein N3C_0851 [Clostridium sp. N3C]